MQNAEKSENKEVNNRKKNKQINKHFVCDRLDRAYI